MLEPQGTVFLVLLVLVFAGLVAWLAVTKQVVIRVLAAVVAFIPAAVFGIAVVNKYYDYYQTWGALYSDLSGSGAQSIPQLAGPQPGSTLHGGSLGGAITASARTALSAQNGFLFQATVTGRTSHISRKVYVYLPPQYFQPAYKGYRFPALELLHGSPGEPQAWIDVMDVLPIYLKLMQEGRAKPAVLVMPDSNGGGHYALQCLNYPHGLQDMTYVGVEVPDWASANLRILPPGPAWGVAGYSEGGYCAANIGLQLAPRFGYVGSLSGYFAPSGSEYPAGGKAGAPPVAMSSPLGRYPKLEALNTPYKYIQRVPLNVQVPQFWLAAGGSDRADVLSARYFQLYAMVRLSNVPLVLIKGGGHQASVWRSALGPMLQWMTPQLANSDRQVERILRYEKSLQARKHPRGKVPATASGPGGSRPLTASTPHPTQTALSR